MTTPETRTGLELRSLVKSGGELELSLVSVPVAEPAADEVIIRVEATPINPSDLGLLFGPADLVTAKAAGTATAPVVTATISGRAMNGMKGRLDRSLTVGNEGAGTVVAAGASREAQDLLGKTVATFGGGMYVQYRRARAAQCVVLPPDCSAADGAAIFVNPMTAVCMVDVMRKEGHTALVNTAAASTLGQMLNRLCLKDGIGLVNVVRSEAQADLLRGIGAVHVCNTSAPTFVDDLTAALAATGATLAFDAIGGGELAGQILSCMEKAINSKAAKGYRHYGSTTHKQVYIYGALDTEPTILKRNCGPAFGVGGWLLTNYLQKVGAGETAKLQARVLAELKTTFASSYTREISLAEALHLDHIAAYSRRTTAGKYLINPARALAPDTLP
jgi:NADPH2:quinone reductase